MKARTSVAFVLAGALGLGAASFAYAQMQGPQGIPPAPPFMQQQQPGPQGQMGMGQGMGQGMNQHMMGMGMGMGMHPGMGMMGGRKMDRMSKEDRAAFFDARIAAVHAGLRLTPDQEKMWPSVESAVRDMARTMSDLRDKRNAAGAPKDPIEGMRRMSEAQIARGEAMKKVADAAGPLYATLTDEQKARLPMLGHGGMRQRMGGWMREHGMNWGWGRGERENKL